MTIDSFEGEYSWLSNFHPVEVKLGGEKYPSVEHAYQAAKTNDPEERREIKLLKKASLAKSKGKRVTMRKDWERVKLEVMENLLRQKFEDPTLRSQLLATGTEELVEGNWWGDVFWGVCRGEGKNHLGRLLMKVRTELQKKP
ncbi:MAG: NADAR family protein [Spirochaetes bacterium]|nr:MAG: NADAR family protein [Spirochaetota bacterium]